MLAPFESPIEELFFHNVVKYVDDGVRVDDQQGVKTRCGHFRLDLVIRREGRRAVAIECDGKGFHDPRRDEWRDALILETGAVDAIYRFTGSSIFNDMNGILYSLASSEPLLFGDRGRENLRRKLSESAGPEYVSVRRLQVRSRMIP